MTGQVDDDIVFGLTVVAWVFIVGAVFGGLMCVLFQHIRLVWV